MLFKINKVQNPIHLEKTSIWVPQEGKMYNFDEESKANEFMKEKIEQYKDLECADKSTANYI